MFLVPKRLRERGLLGQNLFPPLTGCDSWPSYTNCLCLSAPLSDIFVYNILKALRLLPGMYPALE